MDTGQERYQVIITEPAKKSYYEILEVLFDSYSPERFAQIAEELYSKPHELEIMPERGALEPLLSGRKNQYRYLLYHRTKTMTIKIFYQVDQAEKKVYVARFFPTEMNPENL
ncbi:hypothetical protein RCC89_05145 [Cytophagaceae bacterium ABcell3]|nr:hypothetical protein RCC89_05145 [Cytophagaceae bacterium ABcell3]